MRQVTPGRRRRGVSLVELLMALTLWGLLLGVIGVLHTATTRLVVSGSRAVTRQRDLTLLTALVSGAVSGSSAGDIGAGRDSLEFDRPLLAGAPCATDPAAVVIPLPSDDILRTPTAGRDQVLLLDPTPAPAWQRRNVTDVSPAVCPDGRSALLLQLSGGVPPAAWLRLVTPVRLRGYSSGGSRWLGLEDRLGGAGIQPVAGPMAGPVEFVNQGGLLLTATAGPSPQHFATLLGDAP